MEIGLNLNKSVNMNQIGIFVCFRRHFAIDHACVRIKSNG